MSTFKDFLAVKQRPVFTGSRFGFGASVVLASDELPSEGGTYLDRGYWSGASDRTTFEVEWATDTSVLTGRGLGPSFGSGGGSGWSTTGYGWWFGGYTNGEGSKTDVYRLDYSNDTTDLADRANMNQGRGNAQQGACNTTYGWVSGGMYGNAGGANSKVERLTFASESGSASQRTNGPESTATCHATGSDANTYLWFILWTKGGAGGVTGENRTYSYRLTFASDTLAMSNRFDSGGGSDPGCVSTLDYGWVGPSTGYVNTSNIRRIEWASDSSGLTVRSGFPYASRSWGASLNNNYAWWWFRSGSDQSNLYRMEFANDTTEASLRAQSSETKRKQASITQSLATT